MILLCFFDLVKCAPVWLFGLLSREGLLLGDRLLLGLLDLRGFKWHFWDDLDWWDLKNRDLMWHVWDDFKLR